MIYRKISTILPLALILFLVSCRDEPQTLTQTALLDRLPDSQAGEIVSRSIEFATGDWQGWASKQTVQYRKTTVQFDENGEERRRLVQDHYYVLHPSPKMHIAWEEDGRRFVIINDGEQAWKWIDGERATNEEDRNHAWNSSFGSHYVFAMPFKLADSGAILTYRDRTDLPDIGPAETVEVAYEDGAGSSGGMHTWTYYFSPEDFRLVANHLEYGPDPEDYDYTEYTDHRVVDGVHMATRRLGYRSNPAGERLDKTSEIFYEDVRFDAPIPASFFELESGAAYAQLLAEPSLGGDHRN